MMFKIAFVVKRLQRVEPPLATGTCSSYSGENPVFCRVLDQLLGFWKAVARGLDVKRERPVRPLGDYG